MTDRKYALTKIKAGDYLLPSNDGATLWRIAKYTDGKSGSLEGYEHDFTVWGIWRWAKPPSGPLRFPRPESIEDWNEWEMWEGMHATRAEAIDAALKVES